MMETIRKFFCQKIDSLGLKQTYVAEKAGITADTLSKMLNGSRKIQADEFLALCKALNVSNDEIKALRAKAA